MFDEPHEGHAEHASDPAKRAGEKADEFRMHAELAAVFEGCRKFDAKILPKLDAELAREVQKAMAKLDRARSPESPIVPQPSAADAAAALGFAAAHDLSTNDYHVYRRPGEVMVARWLEGDQVETFYKRLQAHFDAALDGFKEDERQAHEWKNDPATLAYLKALDAVEVKMAERYLRAEIAKYKLFVLSTQSADEINIAYLCDHVMGVSPVRLVGPVSAPPEDGPTDRDLAWFFKLFSLRGTVDGVERTCFFAYLQKSDDDDGFDVDE